MSFNDEIEIYRLGEGMSLDRLGKVRTGHVITGLGVDGEGRIWGWYPYSPLLELSVNADGTIEHHWHEVVAGRNLNEALCEVEVTDLGPVLAFDDRLARYDSGKGEWITHFPEISLGLPEAMTFFSEGAGLTGWMAFEDPETGTCLLAECGWPAEGPAKLEILPWVGLDRLGKISALATTDIEEKFFLIGGTRGLMVASRGLPTHISPPAKPVIFHEGRKMGQGGGLEVAFGTPVGDFQYSSPGNHAYQHVRYQTRLSGLGEEWSPRTLRTRLDPGQNIEGQYELEVRAVDPFGRVSPVASVGLRILPPWYRTPAAWMAYLLILVLAVYAIVRLRERRLRLRQIELEELVHRRTLELQKANEFKDDFIANLSHEIRNPLNGVIGFIRQMKPGVPAPAPYLKALRGAAHYLQTTVEEVLDFARLQTGHIPVECRDFDIEEIVNGVIEIYRDQAESKGLALTCGVQVPEGMRTHSDARKVQQILGNLTGNAVKFTDTGTVHVEVTLSKKSEEEGNLCIRVEDSGPGIAEEDRQRVFDKFYQTRSRTAKTAGTGLGLALVKRFVEVLDGRVEIKTVLDKGSTFVVNLPVALRALSPLDAGEPEDNVTSLKGLRVLLIEDIEYNRLVLESMLEGFGCLVDSCELGLPGMQMAESNHYNVVFLDWDLPDTTGLEIAYRLRNSTAFDQSTRLVGMTAFATTEVREKCLQAGMNDFLTKPLAPELLQDILTAVAQERHLIRGRGLLQEMAADDSWEKTVQRWAHYLDRYHRELGQCIDREDPEQVRKAAHRLLGHLRMVEVEDVPGVVLDLMTAAQAGDMGGVRMEWDRLRELLARLESELEGFSRR